MSRPLCTDEQQHHHKFNPCHQLFLNKKLPLARKIDIPPRKLLRCRATAMDEQPQMNSFPPTNLFDCDDDDDPYSSDEFRIFEFKIRRCNRSRSHDWTDCPYSHPGEKASRRDPRKLRYCGIGCPEYRRGSCSRGDKCEFAHGVFECRLHPARYRTEACKDGKDCKRKVCFFAHTRKQLRAPDDANNYASVVNPVVVSDGNYSWTINAPLPQQHQQQQQHCCGGYCGNVSSPTSTLMEPSLTLSPPISPLHVRPVSGGVSPPISPVNTRHLGGASRFEESLRTLSYEEALVELMGSMNVSDNSPTGNGNGMGYFANLSAFSSGASGSRYGSGRYFSREDGGGMGDEMGTGGPDLGWVNELLTSAS